MCIKTSFLKSFCSPQSFHDGEENAYTDLRVCCAMQT